MHAGALTIQDRKVCFDLTPCERKVWVTSQRLSMGLGALSHRMTIEASLGAATQVALVSGVSVSHQHVGNVCPAWMHHLTERVAVVFMSKHEQPQVRTAPCAVARLDARASEYDTWNSPDWLEQAHTHMQLKPGTLCTV